MATHDDVKQILKRTVKTNPNTDVNKICFDNVKFLSACLDETTLVDAYLVNHYLKRHNTLILNSSLSVRPWQGQLYGQAIARVGFHYYYNPLPGRFKSIGNSRNEDPTILHTLLYQNINKFKNKINSPYVTPKQRTLLLVSKTNIHSNKLSMDGWSSRIRLFPITERTSRREPRRNIRDPRLKSYRKSSPIKFSGTPINIPLEYDPAADAKVPKRTGRPIQAAAPNMDEIMRNMLAIHAPSPPKKKPFFFCMGRRPSGRIAWAQGRHTNTWLVALSAPRGPTLSGTVSPSPPTLGDPVWALSGRFRCF